MTSATAASRAQLLTQMEVLAVTGAPGLLRIAQFFLIERLFGIDTLGVVANDVFIVNLVGFFSAVGWSTLVLTRIPALESKHRMRSMAGLGRLSLLWTLIGIAVVFGLAQFRIVHRPIDCSILLAAWSAYQLFRHYLLAIKRYRPILITETILLLSVPAVAIFSPAIPMTTAFACVYVPFLLLLIFVFVRFGHWLFVKTHETHAERSTTFRRGVEFSAINFVGSGAQLIVVPFATRIGGEFYAGLIGLIMSVLNVLTMLPRTLSLQTLPDLVKAVHSESKAAILSMLSRLGKHIKWITGVMAIACIVGWWIGGQTLYQREFSLPGANMIFTLLLVSFVLSQLVLPEANYFMAIEDTSVQLKTNALSIGVFLLAAVVILAWGPAAVIGVVALLGASLVATLWRNVILQQKFRRSMIEARNVVL